MYSPATSMKTTLRGLSLSGGSGNPISHIYSARIFSDIDGRIGNGYTLGGRQFIERFKVGMFVPMHFVASGFESSWRMKEFTDEKGIPFWEITKEGETIEL